MPSVMELSSLRNHWSWSKLKNSFKIFSKVWGIENIPSHIARAVLQARALCQQGCLGHSAVAWASPAGPTPCLGSLGTLPGQAGEG